MRRPSLLPVPDIETRRVFEAILREMEALSDRLGKVVNEQGVFIGNLPEGVKISTGAADAPVVGGASATTLTAANVTYADASTVESLQPGAAGADFVKGTDDSDDITEGAVKLFVGSSGSGDLDDVDEGTTYKRVAAGAVDASGRVTTVRKTAGDVAVDNVLDKSNDTLDDVPDGATYLRPAGIDASHQATASSLGADCVIRNKILDTAVSGSKVSEGTVDEFQAMGSSKSDAEWDALAD